MNAVIDEIFNHKRANAERMCCADEQESMNYGEFFLAISKAAAYLTYRGVGKRDVVMICAMHRIHFLIAYFAVQSIGAIPCPIDNKIQERRILEIANEIQTKWYIGRKKYKNTQLKKLDYKEMLEFNLKMEDGWFYDNIDNDEQISNIIFTTGTTGKSKGIAISHRADMALSENIIHGVQMDNDEVEMITTPLNHSLSIRRMCAVMVRGGFVVLSDSYLFPDKLFELIELYNVTAMTFVPAILNLLFISSKERIGKYNKQLHYIQLGAAPIYENQKDELVRILPEVRLYNIYGSTESGCTTVLEFSRYRNKKDSIGKPTINTKIKFINDNGEYVNSIDRNTAGRMAFSGRMNMSGYFNNFELTAEVLKDGEVISNDLGYLGKDGFIYFVGRKDDVINMGGTKINPLEIEEIAMKYQGVADCACVAEKDAIVGEIPILYIVERENHRVDLNKIKEFLCENLDVGIVPKQILRVSSIPRTYNGKTIRRNNDFSNK